MRNRFQQYSETDRLTKVVIGRVEGYKKVEEYIERVNASQKNELLSLGSLQKEFEIFAETLKAHGVEVLRPNYVGKFVYDQLTPRDIGVTIGDKFVICNMAKSSRRYEVAGIFEHILSVDGPEPTILIPPEPTMLLEGGDIIVDKEHIFVGLTSRTNSEGADFLKQAFGSEFDVGTIQCKSQILHLDCVFNPVGKNHALIYPDGIERIPEAIASNYTLIEVTQNEQQALATNVLSLSPERVISREHPDCRRVNQKMREAEIQVLNIPFDSAPATGGSLRCCSLPLIRVPKDS